MSYFLFLFQDNWPVSLGLFEGDQDIDIACELPESIGFNTDWEYSLSSLIHQTDMLAGNEALQFYKTSEYLEKLKNEIVPYIRSKLDENDFGQTVFAACRTKEDELVYLQDGKYRTILLGALMMRAGAKIRDEDIQHLRDLVPYIHCSPRYALPIFDVGFRSPGRAQFLAALDNYRVGVPRSFQEPRYVLVIYADEFGTNCVIAASTVERSSATSVMIFSNALNARVLGTAARWAVHSSLNVCAWLIMFRSVRGLIGVITNIVVSSPSNAALLMSRCSFLYQSHFSYEVNIYLLKINNI